MIKNNKLIKNEHLKTELDKLFEKNLIKQLK